MVAVSYGPHVINGKRSNFCSSNASCVGASPIKLSTRKSERFREKLIATLVVFSILIWYFFSRIPNVRRFFATIMVFESCHSCKHIYKSRVHVRSFSMIFMQFHNKYTQPNSIVVFFFVVVH